MVGTNSEVLEDFWADDGQILRPCYLWLCEFFNQSITVLQTLVVAIGAGLGVWGAINLLEGYGNDNPGSKSQGMKQFMAN